MMYYVCSFIQIFFKLLFLSTNLGHIRKLKPFYLHMYIPQLIPSYIFANHINPISKMNTPIPAKSSRPNQSKPTSIPVLVRNRCVHSGKKSNIPNNHSVPLIDLGKYSREDEYIVDDTPIEEGNGMGLQLKLPILKPKKQTHTSFPFEVTNNMGIGPIPERGTSVGIGRFSGETNSMPATRAQSEFRSENAFENIPIISSPINERTRGLVHIGYAPVTEEEAFANTNIQNIHIPSLPCTHFTIPRGDMSIDSIINLIREVVAFNENLHPVIGTIPERGTSVGIGRFSGETKHEFRSENPSNMIDNESRKIYESSLIYTYFDETGYRAVKLQVSLQVSPNNPSMVPISGYSSNPGLSYRESGVLPNPDNIFVIVERLRGDTRPFLAIYNTLRNYIKSEGTSNCRVSPKMSSYSSTLGFDEIGFANTNISVFDM